MNMVQAELARADGHLEVSFGGTKLRLDDSVLESRPDVGRFEGRTVILGIRPEDMDDAGIVEAPEDRRLRVVPDLIESLGSEKLLHFTIDAPIVLTEDVRDLAVDVGSEHLEQLEREAEHGRSAFVAALNPKTDAQEGQPIELAVDTARVTSSTRRPASASTGDSGGNPDKEDMCHASTTTSVLPSPLLRTRPGGRGLREQQQFDHHLGRHRDDRRPHHDGNGRRRGPHRPDARGRGGLDGDEQKHFKAVTDLFAQQTGAKVQYTSTGDDIATVLGTRIQGGSPPDVAFFPSPA